MSDYTKEENDQYFSDVPARLPYYPSPCIGSGYCCKTAPCIIAMWKYKDLTPWQEKKGCPSLRFDEQADRYFCGEVLDAPTEEARDRLVRELAIGAGCCSAMNSTRLDKLRKMKEARDGVVRKAAE